ncbi:PKD domain-containing protein [bacterium]|nr:PKD domain-containing protein [bacterium]
MESIRNILLTALLASLLSACGGRGTASLPETEDAVTGLHASAAGMELELSSDSFIYGGRAEGLSLLVSEQEDGSLLAEISLERAEQLRAVYFTIAYDTEHWHAVESAAAADFADADELISLGVLDTATAMHHGQLFVHPQNADGFSGSGVVASVRFAPGARDALREAAKAPSGPGSRSDISYVYGSTFGLFWHYYNQGDYDQNGEVNISDLTPLGIHLREAGPWSPASIQGVIDGDGNGEINLADITPIGSNFGARISSYNLYASDDIADYPATGGASTIEPYATKELGDYQLEDKDHPGPLPKDGRLFYWGSIIAAGISGGEDYNFYWVRPSDGEAEGTASYILASPFYSEFFGDSLEPPAITVDGISGSGRFDEPMLLEPGGEYKVNVIDPLLGDLSTDPQMRYRVVQGDGAPWPHATLSNSDAILRVATDAPQGNDELRLQYFFGLLSYDQGMLGGLPDEDGPRGLTLRSGPPLMPPSALLAADVLQGEAPLTVQFDGTGSSSPNGEIRFYNWEFDLYGSSFGFSNEAQPQYTYEEPGVYVVELRVNDDWVQQASTQQVVKVLPAGGTDPVASILADVRDGDIPLTINFSAEYSQAAAGRSIVKYEWDLDGDEGNGFELDTGIEPSAQMTYTVAGLLTTRVRVTDDMGATAEAELAIVPLEPFSYPPDMDLVIDVTEGSSPLTVNFDGSGTTDPDGTIVKWGWDFNGDGDLELFDLSDPVATSMESFTYETSGAFRGYFYAWDNDDNLGVFPFVIRTDGAPTAALEYPGGPFFGTPKTIEFDASASTDAGGSIVEYRWDFEDDGVVDLTTTEPLVSHEFTMPGFPIVRVTVVDDDGLTDFYRQTFSIY